MSGRFDEIWEKSRASSVRGLSRAFPPGQDCEILLWVSQDQVRHCLVPCSDSYRFDEQRVASVLRVGVRKIALETRADSRYLDIQCVDESGFRIFDYFIEDTISRPDQSVGAVESRLREYRHFWQPPSMPLSDKEAIGLFGELWFMHEWLSGPTGNRLDAWAGGTSSTLHDFSWARADVEVKASTSGVPARHTVGSLDQLDAGTEKALLLFSLATRRDDAAGTRLHDLYKNFRASLDSDDERYRLDRLVAGRHFRPDDPDNDRHRYIIVDDGGRLFEVRDGFPRIVRSSFVGGHPPSGVGAVSYELTLADCDEFESGLKRGILPEAKFGEAAGPFD